MSHVVDMEPYSNAKDSPMSTLRRRKPVVDVNRILGDERHTEVAMATTSNNGTGDFATPQTSSFAHDLRSPAAHHKESSHRHNVEGRFGDIDLATSSGTDQELKGKQKILDEGGSEDDASMDPRSSLNKRIFLSYSGHQRPFVEQLFLDLKNAGYSPFFDQDIRSLPKGDEFPGLIFQAARECHVAVVVLSQDYLQSKWPMLELAAFVKAQRSVNPKLKILPLFYKLDVRVLKDIVARRELLENWTVLANQDSRISLAEWMEAIDVLPRINGLVLGGGSEVEYRSATLASLYNLCCPEVQFKLPTMDGQERWCKLLERELQIEKLMDAKHPLIGIYGMGGLGKTLLCKALCNHFHERFDGKVCYVDFCSGSSVIMKREILTRLTNVDSRLLETIRHEEECDRLLEAFLPQQKVFLAIDNICYSTASDAVQISNSLAQIFGVLSKESISIVTSRSLEMLRGAAGMETLLMHMPTLSESEALQFFLRVALPSRALPSLISDDELEVVKSCLSRCAFVYTTSPVKEFQLSVTYVHHPMALRALAYALVRVDRCDPLEWARQGKIPEKLASDDLEGIYKILKQGYDVLDAIEKLLFMDVAVFAPRDKMWNLNKLREWLIGVHGIDVQNKLMKLEMMSFLEIKGDGSVILHDVYKGFACHELELEAERRRCVYTSKGDALPWSLASTAPGACWPDLKRVKLQSSLCVEFESSGIWWILPDEGIHLRVPEEKLREWANLQVLHLEFAGEHIDIGPLKCLRALVLVANKNLKTFTCSTPLEQLRFVAFKCFFAQVTQVPTFTSSRLEELQMHFGMYSLRRPFTLPLQASALTKLKLFRWYSSRQDEFLNFEQFPNLTELYMNSELPDHGLCRISVSGLSSLTKLRKLYFRSIPIEGPLLGLHNLVSLESLHVRMCYKIRSLPGLDSLTNLKELNVSGTPVEDLDGVENLMELDHLFCINCKFLRHLPDLSSLPQLCILHVKGCDLLESYSVSQNCVVPDDCEPTQGPRPTDWFDAYRVALCRREALSSTDDRLRPILDNLKAITRHCEEQLSKSVRDPSIGIHLEAMENQRAQHQLSHVFASFVKWIWYHPFLRYQVKYFRTTVVIVLTVFLIRKLWTSLVASHGDSKTLLFITDFVVGFLSELLHPTL